MSIIIRRSVKVSSIGRTTGCGHNDRQWSEDRRSGHVKLTYRPKFPKREDCAKYSLLSMMMKTLGLYSAGFAFEIKSTIKTQLCADGCLLSDTVSNK